ADLVRTVSPGRAQARLLNSREHSEGRAAGEGADAEKLPAGAQTWKRSQSRQELKGKVLDQAGAEDVRKIESGESLVEGGASRILRGRLQNGARNSRDEPAEYAARVIDRAAIGVVRLKPKTESR